MTGEPLTPLGGATVSRTPKWGRSEKSFPQWRVPRRENAPIKTALIPLLGTLEPDPTYHSPADTGSNTINLSYYSPMPLGKVKADIVFNGTIVGTGHTASATFYGVGANLTMAGRENGFVVNGYYRDANGMMMVMPNQFSQFPTEKKYTSFMPAAPEFGIYAAAKCFGGGTGKSVHGSSLSQVIPHAGKIGTLALET